MATYEELQADVQAAVNEVDRAIALTSLSRRFNEDDRISERFDNTYEAHAFVLCRWSVEYCLALALVRCHDHRRDSHGLTSFFNMIDDDATRETLKVGIFNRQRKLADKEEAQKGTEDYIQEVETARDLQQALRGSHQFGRVKAFRHAHVAHWSRQAANIQPTRREYLYELTASTKEIVQLLCGAVLGVSEDFEGGEEIWEGYTRRFFNVMMEPRHEGCTNE